MQRILELLEQRQVHADAGGEPADHHLHLARDAADRPQQRVLGVVRDEPETAVAAGAVAKKLLAHLGVEPGGRGFG